MNKFKKKSSIWRVKEKKNFSALRKKKKKKNSQPQLLRSPGNQMVRP